MSYFLSFFVLPMALLYGFSEDDQVRLIGVLPMVAYLYLSVVAHRRQTERLVAIVRRTGKLPDEL